ncbi:DgyrCDS6763 [Dimorphilus gyrociliatus]|uniref:DgyrCDS6763 n=1 Tax=Dimorphilus gyrociliatus TaxID=2664684 RepID=A0A7I8VNZ4_9ANNE|nr:DgyrCDS6763 [Dimorphilus gyrociliatus]
MARLMDIFLEMTAEAIWSILEFAFYPLLILLSVVIILAGCGCSVGIRQLYVKVLLIVFEWGREKIREKEERRESNEVEPEPVANGVHVIEREIELNSKGTIVRKKLERLESITQTSEFQLHDALDFFKCGIESIIEDEVTQRFSAAELASWNLLTRTNTYHQFISYRLTTLWFIGFFLRYFILFPFRLILIAFAIISLITGNTILGYLKAGVVKRWLTYRLHVTCMRLGSRAFSAVIRFHDKENKAKGGGICVANHTSPIDIIILGCDNMYAMVGQQQGGLFGAIQKGFSRAESHIWFQRSEVKDREAVARRLKEHVSDINKLPILIFPEGTCINNTSIMMFKKGSFEVGSTIYPVAIKYDSRFADPFWNSSQENFAKHLINILSSWAIVVDVWYLPPQTQREGESSVQFANRVKSYIAERGGLVDLNWDGGLKRAKPKPQMMQKQQEDFSRRLKTD